MSGRGGGRGGGRGVQPSPNAGRGQPSRGGAGRGRGGRGNNAPPSSSLSGSAAPLRPSPPPQSMASVSHEVEKLSLEASSSTQAPAPANPPRGQPEAITPSPSQGQGQQVSAPASSKALRNPPRPGFGTVGLKTIVKANHFLVTVADRDLHHYDVSKFFFLKFFCVYGSSLMFNFGCVWFFVCGYINLYVWLCVCLWNLCIVVCHELWHYIWCVCVYLYGFSVACIVLCLLRCVCLFVLCIRLLCLWFVYGFLYSAVVIYDNTWYLYFAFKFLDYIVVYKALFINLLSSIGFNFTRCCIEESLQRHYERICQMLPSFTLGKADVSLWWKEKLLHCWATAFCFKGIRCQTCWQRWSEVWLNTCWKKAFYFF